MHKGEWGICFEAFKIFVISGDSLGAAWIYSRRTGGGGGGICSAPFKIFVSRGGLLIVSVTSYQLICPAICSPRHSPIPVELGQGREEFVLSLSRNLF